MSETQDPLWKENARSPEVVMMDAILYDGVDPRAIRRTHMREVTMARQAAERRLALRNPSAAQDQASKAVTARERAEEFRLEMARISADHRRWQSEHGETVTELPERGHHKQPELSGFVPSLASVPDLAR